MPFPPCGPPEAAPADACVVRRPTKPVIAAQETKFVAPATIAKPVNQPQGNVVQQEQKTEPAKTGEQARNPFLVILTAEQARSIYALRSPQTADSKDSFVAGKSSLVAEMYGVSPKTIRDVWNRKTWTQVTRSLWSEQEADLYSREHMTPEQRAALGDTELYLKRRGRPPGSKDARPRKRRFQMFEDSTERPQQDESMCIDELKGLEVSPSACPMGLPSDPQDFRQAELVELHGPCDRSVIPACPDHSEHMTESTFSHMDESEPRDWPMRQDSDCAFQAPPHYAHHHHMHGFHGHQVARHPSSYHQYHEAHSHGHFSPAPEFAEELPGPPCEEYSNPPAEPEENSKDEQIPCPGGNLGRTVKMEAMAVEPEHHEGEGGLFSDDENWFPGAERCGAAAAATSSPRANGMQHTASRNANAFSGDCGNSHNINAGILTSWGAEEDAENEPLDGIDDFWFVLYGHHRAPSPVAPPSARFAEDEDADEGARLLGWCGGGA